MMERHLSLPTVGILLAYAVALAGGQVLFKLAALRFSLGSRWTDNVVSLLLNPYLVLAVLLYALLSVVWVWVLSFVPLSIAYPFVALTFVLTVASGALLFGESVSLRLVLGGLMIISGLIVITR
jgi:drug/metabolite transporter (DMT)-like permease